MDAGAKVYATLITNIAAYFSRLSPQNALKVLNEKLGSLDSAGVKYRLDGSVLDVIDANNQSRQGFYDVTLSYIHAFEGQYGINEIWGQLKIIILKTYQSFRDLVREIGLEIPIVKYSIEYRLESGVIDFQKKEWYKDAVLLTNQKIIFPKGEETEDVPLNAVATVGREVYIGYTTEATKGVIRAIDYKIKASGMSCAVVVAKESIMKDLLNTIRVMRAEYKRLSQTEAKVLLAIYGGTLKNEMSGKCGISQDEAEKAYNKMLALRYVDQNGHLTSYGINASAEIMQANK